MDRLNHQNSEDKLYEACLARDIDRVKAVMTKRDGSIRNINYEIGFYGACESGDEDIMELMLYVGDTQDININAGLKIACGKGHINIVRILKEDYCADDFNGGLYDAALHGHVDVVILLLGYGAFAYDGGLFAACAGGHVKVASIMINMGANDWGRCFGVACLSGHVRIVDMLYDKSTHYINDGVIKACSRGRSDVVKYLLGKGFCPEWKWAYCVAKKEGYHDLSEYILDYGNKVTKPPIFLPLVDELDAIDDCIPV